MPQTLGIGLIVIIKNNVNAVASYAGLLRRGLVHIVEPNLLVIRGWNSDMAMLPLVLLIGVLADTCKG